METPLSLHHTIPSQENYEYIVFLNYELQFRSRLNFVALSLQYHIPKSTIGVGGVFKVLEEAKANYDIEDYSVSQTSIEQVFLNFAREQRDGRVDTQASCAQKYIYCSFCVCMFPEVINEDET